MSPPHIRSDPTPFISNFSIEPYEEATLQERHEIDEWGELLAEFKPELDTKMLVHGWKSSTQSRSIQSIRQAYTKRGMVNVFAINWRDQADSIYYLKPARYAIHVGRAVSRLIDSLVEKRHADPQRIHLIGHSLGAHIMGYAGSYSRHRVGRITGKFFTTYSRLYYKNVTTLQVLILHAQLLRTALALRIIWMPPMRSLLM